MTREEAEVKARRRWGENALVWEVPYTSGLFPPMCMVGHPRSPVPYGAGRSWEAAFQDADRRAK